MNNVYLVLSYSGTFISRMIKTRYPEGPYCHVSLSLDRQLEQMYSFGRKGTYNMLNAGFIQEDIENGLFRIKDVLTKIYELPVTDEQYRAIQDEITDFTRRRDELHFDGIGLILKVVRPEFSLEREDYYYCSRFVGELLKRSQAAELPADPRLMHPTMFAEIDGTSLVYEGRLKEYRAFLQEAGKFDPR